LAAGAGWLGAHGFGVRRAAAIDEVLPKHIDPRTIKSIKLGLDYLAKSQGSDGGWHDTEAGQAYPVAMSALAGMALLANGCTPSRGPYGSNVQGAIDYLIQCRGPSGLITGANQESGRPMHGHGFALMFLGSAYDMEANPTRREKMRENIEAAIKLTAGGQSAAGGWTYVPGQGDEGSVTVSQVQALRACHNAGFHIPKGTIEESVRYIERCSTPEGGICYSLNSGGGPRLAISAAAVATLYNAGEYEAPVAERCLAWVWQQFEATKGWSKGSWHDTYSHLYASQAFYLAGDKYWDKYFPETRDQLLAMQDAGDGSWPGDGIGKPYGTAVSLIILQLPFKYLPIYQR
jgi:hypothetical protein